MDLLNIVVICAFLVIGLGIIVVLKKGFNEVIKGMQSLDERLQKVEKTLKNRQ